MNAPSQYDHNMSPRIVALRAGVFPLFCMAEKGVVARASQRRRKPLRDVRGPTLGSESPEAHAGRRISDRRRGEKAKTLSELGKRLERHELGIDVAAISLCTRGQTLK